MQQELTQLIDRYLLGELSAADRAQFEEKLKNSPKLQEAVKTQQQLTEVIRRSALRTLVEKTGKRYHIKHTLKWSLVIAVVLSGLSFVLTLLIQAEKQQSKKENNKQPLSTQVRDSIDQGELIDQLAPELFRWNGNDTVLLTRGGILVSLAEGSFLKNGKPYSGETVLVWQEATTAAQIVKSGLSTTSDGRLLETQGMFSIRGLDEAGNELKINPKTGVYVQVPVDNYQKGMRLFTGEKDKNGFINWVNPRKLNKIPVSVPMKELDFYPPGYEDSLDALKLRKNKKFRDSLYLSCEEMDVEVQNKNEHSFEAIEVESRKLVSEQVSDSVIRERDWSDKISWNITTETIDASHIYVVATATLKEGWHIFSVNHDPKKADFIGFPTKIKLLPSDAYSAVGNTEDGLKPQREDSELGISYVFYNKAIFRQKVRINKKNTTIRGAYAFQICDKNGCIFPPDQQFSIKINGTSTGDHIPPAAVLGFWNPAFDHTILATREFEKRMKAIHATCNPDVLEVYLKHPEKALYDLDAEVVQLGYGQFQQFADEQVGAIQIGSAHAKNLQEIYRKSVSELREAVRKNLERRKKKEATWDKQVKKTRQKHSETEQIRNRNSYQEEAQYNYEDALKQLGERPRKLRRQLTASVGVTIRNSGVYNLDKFVYETTGTRQTAVYTDPKSGKQASLRYTDWTTTIANRSEFQQVHAYFFPHELTSYLRIPEANGSVRYALNEQLTYDLVVVGISENGYAFYRENGIGKNKNTSILLKTCSESQLDVYLNDANNRRNHNSLKLSGELKWLQTEQQNYQVINQRTEAAAFRKRIRQIVFPCSSDVPQKLSNQEEEQNETELGL